MATPFLLHALEHMTQAVYLYDREDESFAYVNRFGAASLGYTQEELLGAKASLVNPTMMGEHLATTLERVKRERRVRFETTHQRRDGSWFPVEVTVTYLEDRGRAFHVVVALDVSTRTKAEEALRKSENLYRSLFETMAEGVIVRDASGCITAINQAGERILGRRAAELMGQKRSAFEDALMLDGRRVPEGARPLDLALRTGEPQMEVVLSVPRPDGTRVWVSVNCRPLRSPDVAGVTGVVTTFHDITDRVVASREVHAREQLYRTLTNNIPDVIVRWDRALRRVFMNPSAVRIAGRMESELLGRVAGTNYAPSTHLDDSQHVERKLREVFERGQALPIELTLRTAEGPRTLDLLFVPEYAPDGEIATVLGVGRDVTALHLANDAMRASETRLRQVTESIDEVFWLIDKESGDVVYVSPAFQRVYGTDAARLLAHPRAWLDAVHPDDLAYVERAMAQGADAPEIEYRVRDGEKVRWIRHRWFSISHAQGERQRIAAVSEDVSHRRELETQLRQAQKMEAIGNLAGGIAHEFNNLLTVVQLQASTLADEVNDGASVREGLAEIGFAASRASHLTQQLLTFSRRQAFNPSLISLSESVQRTSNMLRRLVGENIVFDVRVTDTLPPIYADPAMIDQVLFNLVINARDAMQQGGRLTVTVSQEAQHGLFLCLTVADTGHGMESQHVPRIFEPFFTTKDVGKGSGLGLATVLGIVEQHGGRIEVDSEAGKGATFRVLLPASGDVTPTPRAVHEEPLSPGNGQMILLVEDEPALRNVTRHVLTEHGYRVVVASSAAEALAQLEHEPCQIDLLFTDVVMPGGVSARELADRLTARFPTMRVLFTSGYSHEVLGSDVAALGENAFLAKPYTSQELLTAVRAQLTSARVGVR